MLRAENSRVRKSGTVPNEGREERWECGGTLERVELIWRKFRGKAPRQRERESGVG